MKKEDLIDPKNPHTVGRSFANLGNHTLTIIFISIIGKFLIFVVYSTEHIHESDFRLAVSDAIAIINEVNFKTFIFYFS